MLEMLSVLAIVGVISLGAITGYSNAIAKHKANQAVDEIRTAITKIKDLYADKNNFNGINTTLLLNAGVLPENAKNTYNLNINIGSEMSSSIFSLKYNIPDVSVCKKILSANWIFNDKIRIYASRAPGGTSISSQPTIDELNTICVDVVYLNFYVSGN
ncbi:MAG: hypothetical protein GY804_03150 [Alphaproteobacteria bacterium]|nr:hypothetical protein [Alphaproteobacteria bacterium]